MYFCMLRSSFNSMIVRLKVKSSVKNELRLDGFNSMIVRLKAIKSIIERCLRIMFQFYDSPIKSQRPSLSIRRNKSFNSMIVRLKVRACD